MPLPVSGSAIYALWGRRTRHAAAAAKRPESHPAALRTGPTEAPLPPLDVEQYVRLRLPPPSRTKRCAAAAGNDGRRSLLWPFSARAPYRWALGAAACIGCYVAGRRRSLPGNYLPQRQEGWQLGVKVGAALASFYALGQGLNLQAGRWRRETARAAMRLRDEFRDDPQQIRQAVEAAAQAGDAAILWRLWAELDPGWFPIVLEAAEAAQPGALQQALDAAAAGRVPAATVGRALGQLAPLRDQLASQPHLLVGWLQGVSDLPAVRKGAGLTLHAALETADWQVLRDLPLDVWLAVMQVGDAEGDTLLEKLRLQWGSEQHEAATSLVSRLDAEAGRCAA